MPPRRSITAFCLSAAIPMVCASQDAPPAVEVPIPDIRKIPAVSMLPDGSELDDVTLPRYDEQLRLTSILRAKKLTLVSQGYILGDEVHITLIDPEEPDNPTTVKMAKGLLDQHKGIIVGEGDVVITSPRFVATGSKIHFVFETGIGFLSGPAATTLFAAPTTTAMHQPPARNSHSPMLAAGMLGVAMVSAPLVEARPPAVTAEEIAAIQREAASLAPQAAIEKSTMDAAVATARVQSADLSNAARTFLINQVLEPGEAPPAAVERPPAAPLEVKNNPEDTLIKSDGGLYFDAETGVLVYLKNVRVTDPRYTLEGADELKIIFEKKDEAAKPAAPEAEEKDEADGFGAGVGKVERIIATGRVLFKQLQAEAGKAPIEASGALFKYDIMTGEIIISGGFPWVRQGNYYARALEPNLNLRIQKNGSFVTEGNWDTGQTINP